MNRNPYEILGISPSATKVEIRKAWIQRTKVLHPDRFDKTTQADEWKMANTMLAEINGAYGFLIKQGSSSPPPIPSSPPPFSGSKAPPPRRPDSSTPPPRREPPKSRRVYITLAIFLGYFGVHNFYARRLNRGIFQAGLGILGLSSPSWYIASAVWILIDILKVKEDGDGAPFISNSKNLWRFSRLQWGIGAVGLLFWGTVIILSISKTPSPSVSLLTPHIDQQALAWLAANPNDPNAEGVRRKLIERGVLMADSPVKRAGQLPLTSGDALTAGLAPTLAPAPSDGPVAIPMRLSGRPLEKVNDANAALANIRFAERMIQENPDAFGWQNWLPSWLGNMLSSGADAKTRTDLAMLLNEINLERAAMRDASSSDAMKLDAQFFPVTGSFHADTQRVALNKTQALEIGHRIDYSVLQKSLTRTGYMRPDDLPTPLPVLSPFSALAPNSDPGGPLSKATPLELQVLDYIQKNPNDPRAPRVQAILASKGLLPTPIAP